MRLRLRLALIVMSLAAGVLVGVDQLRDDEALDAWAGGAAIAVAGVTALRSGLDVRREREEQRDAQDGRVLSGAAAALLRRLSAITGVSYEHWGIHVYRVDNGVLGLRKRNESRPQLRRVVKLRLSARPRATNIVWRLDKGVLGLAVKNPSQLQRYPVHDAIRVYTDDPATWEASEQEVNLNLTYDELIRCKEYSWVFAMSIVDVRDGSVAGIISADLPTVPEALDLEIDATMEGEVNDAVTSAVVAIANEWFPQ